MPNLFSMKRGDTLPLFSATLYVDKENTQPVDLTNAQNVRVRVRKEEDETFRVDRNAEILEPRTDGRIELQLTNTESATTGNYLAEVRITWSNEDVQTFPLEGFLSFKFNTSLDL